MIAQPFISIISPVYAGQGILRELVTQIVKAVSTITKTFEIILIEDHSPDQSWEEIVEITRQFSYVKGVRLSKNFGQHNAITAGMELAKGDYVVLLDCDLQHDPAYIPELYKLIQQGNDIVFTRFKKRKHGFVKNATALLYYKLIKFFSGYNMDPHIGSYSIVSRKVVNAFNKYNDYKKMYLWVLNWMGFKFDVLEINHHQRHSGKSAYSLKRLFVLAFNLMFLNSNRPLYFSTCLGLMMSLASFFAILNIMYQYFHSGALLGWSSTVIFIIFFSGIILTSIGVSAIYIANIFEQTKQRPRYIISEQINLNNDEA